MAAIRPRFLTEALKSGNVANIAQALARYHAPSVRFDMTLSRIDSYYYGYEEKLIRWCVTDGLSCLLHELGHHANRHKTEPCCDGQTLKEEAEAWLWAEKWAHKHGIKFDYKMADIRFWNYQKERPIILVNWELRNGASI